MTTTGEATTKEQKAVEAMIDNIIKADTMEAKLLRLLERGWTGHLAALQEAGCFTSLSQRVGEFIRDGYHIEKRWVKLASGKQVREYRLAPKDYGRETALYRHAQMVPGESCEATIEERGYFFEHFLSKASETGP